MLDNLPLVLCFTTQANDNIMGNRDLINLLTSLGEPKYMKKCGYWLFAKNSTTSTRANVLAFTVSCTNTGESVCIKHS